MILDDPVIITCAISAALANREQCPAIPYTTAEYAQRRGWGHSARDDAVRFALRAEVARLALFHHDPGRSDSELEALLAGARRLWQDDGRDPGTVIAAAEGMELELR